MSINKRNFLFASSFKRKLTQIYKHVIVDKKRMTPILWLPSVLSTVPDPDELKCMMTLLFTLANE